MEIPGPYNNIHLNTLKHHIRAITRLIADCPVPGLRQRLKILGASQMDLYLGDLEETEICRQVLQALSALGIHTEQQYRDWLEQHHHYQHVTLSDSSVWILRLGKERDRYIHLHPGRYAAATIRVKAAVLKTAIATWAYLKNGLISEVNDDSLNRVRKEVLELPPLKSLAESHAILKMIGIIETNAKGLEEF
ncbi:MAG TPA: hypothetical protein VGE79_01420 [Niastella sp.]